MTTGDNTGWGSNGQRGPDLLTGFKDAAERLGAVLADADRRLILAEVDESEALANPRIGDVRIHTQYRQDYARRTEKRSIVDAAEAVLEETVYVKNPEADARFEEALSALQVEEERIFVCVLLGSHWDLVYWNWRYGYSVARLTDDRGRAIFATDLERRSVASPALARTCYGSAVISVASTNPR